MDQVFWRKKWGDFYSNVFMYACKSKHAPGNVQMPFQQRMDILRYFVVVCTFVKKEIKKYAENPDLEAANLGLDLGFMFIQIMLDFVMNPNLPAFEGSDEERNDMEAEFRTFLKKLESIEFDEENDDTNINNHGVDFAALELAYNLAVQNIPIEQEENNLRLPFLGNSNDAPFLFTDDMLDELDEEINSFDEQKANEDIQHLVQEIKKSGGMGVWHQVDDDGNVSVFDMDSKKK